MKYINFNRLNSNNKINKDGLKKGFITVPLASITLLISLVGCNKKMDETISTSEVPTYSNSIIEELEEEIEPSIEEITYDYTREMWNLFVDSSWHNINGIINNANKNDFESALMTLNIDYLVQNNPTILQEAYDDGIDYEAELNKLYNLISELREYNTTITNSEDFYSLEQLVLEKNNIEVIGLIENYAKEIIAMGTDYNEKRVIEIFSLIKSFSMGESTLNVNGKDISQISLSYGGVIASEVDMQTISVLSQPVVSYEERLILDNSLRTRDVLAQIQIMMAEQNGIASITNPDVIDNSILTNTNYIIDYNYNILNEYDVTREELISLFTVSNIDYLMNSNNGKLVLNELFSNGLNLNELMDLSSSAVAKIEEHNFLNSNINSLYDYTYLLLDEEDIYSVRGVVLNAFNYKSNDEDIRNQAFVNSKFYHQYSNNSTITYMADDVEYRLDKNALTIGAEILVDLIETEQLTHNMSNINNQFYNDMMEYVDAFQSDLAPYPEMVLMVDEFCAQQNIVVYYDDYSK